VASVNQVHRIIEALGRVEERVRRIGGREITIVAVTKGFGAEVVAAARAAGCRHLGESYAQELLAKSAAFGVDDSGARPLVHFIGGLQTNKVRQIAALVDLYESVDRPSLIAEIARRHPGAAVLIQVNSTGETTKGGCLASETETLVSQARAAGLEVRGLMTVGPTGAEPAAAAPGFAMVRRQVDELGLSVCSMGMSADLEVAIEAGSTEIRVGSDIFGPRPPR
jgi:pyridoxal phosphate enzyme (YggS family)